MKIKYLVSVFIWIVSSFSLTAHHQHVHQYIVKEAYELLINQLGYAIPEMNDHIGGIGSEYHGNYAWHKPFITTGAWREDMEDPIFNYDFLILQGVNIALVSITHFWDADDGDLNKNFFPIVLPVPPYPSLDIGPYENAYDKLLQYSEGNWVLWYPDSMFCINQANGHQLVIIPEIVLPTERAGIPVKYFSITNFYNNSELSLLADQGGEFIVFDLTTLNFINPEDAPVVIVENNIRDRIAWEVLGRMCHLLGDLSIPAHSHRDEHGLNPDSYENWMGSSSQPYLYWNSTNSGEYIDPYNSDNDPLHYLMYIMQQQSDHFSSNGPGSIGNGNNDLHGNPRPEELILLNTFNISGYGEPTSWNGPWDTENLENIRDKTFPFVIRATAGLLYWFAIETGLAAPTTVNETESISSFHLFQNYPNPFNPTTKIKYTIPSSHLSLGEGQGVRLIVYDVLGNKVATLVDEYKPAGSYEVEWNASGFASGVYFYRLQVYNSETGSGKSFVETKKLILMK